MPSAGNWGSEKRDQTDKCWSDQISDATTNLLDKDTPARFLLSVGKYNESL